MADPTVVSVDSPPHLTGDCDSGFHISPLRATFFSENLLIGDCAPVDIQNDDVSILEGFDFDFSFDDLDDLLRPAPRQQPNFCSGADVNLDQSGPNLDRLHAVFKSNHPELRHIDEGGDFAGDRSWEGSGVLTSASPDMESQQVSGYLNVPSPESNGSNRGCAENCGGDAAKVSNFISPESQGSGNFESNVSEDSDNCATRSVSYSPDSSKCSIKTGVAEQEIKLEELANKNGNSSLLLLKRKKEGEEKLMDNDDNVESRTNKYRKSNCSEENNISSSDNNNVESTEEEEKRKARLFRNRESAQLSRQRKKHYVEELEDKVRNMHSTIQDLNAKISFFMAENATMRQQMSCSGGAGGGAITGSAFSPPPGMYSHPPMMYPWMPCPPPYMVKPQGSQVPLVSIPRLKTQKPTQAPKRNKKEESKKNEGPKTKKVASVSFLGLLFFIMLFGGLVPMVNVRYGGFREALTGGGSQSIGVGFSEKRHGRVLMVNGTEYGEKKLGGFRDSSSNSSTDDFVPSGNGSEPLAASLYVPRNDKLVKIDGNLIIHSFLATEKAMASRGKECDETGLVVPGNLAPAISVPDVGKNGAKHLPHSPHLRALGSSSGDKDSVKSTTDGSLQQWFQEGLTGPMLSSGMCTEVFQFDISAAGAIIPAPTTRDISEEKNQNSTHPKSGRNRRILHPVPLPEPSHNISKEHPGGTSSEKDTLHGNKNSSSMVVSVLFDPREVGDADEDSVMGTKSVPRIFVVVLTDSVKYVTYSCMLPFTGSVPHVVTA